MVLYGMLFLSFSYSPVRQFTLVLTDVNANALPAVVQRNGKCRSRTAEWVKHNASGRAKDRTKNSTNDSGKGASVS